MKVIISVLFIFSLSLSFAQTPCDSLDLGDTLISCLNETVKLQVDYSVIPGASNIEWMGSGTFLPSNKVSNPQYIPTQQEYSFGSATLSVDVNVESSKFITYDHSGQDLLFYIDPIDGSIDSIQKNTGKDWTAMGFRAADCLVYGLSNIVNEPMLSSIDPETAAVVDIYNYPDHQFYAGEYDNVNDKFYAIGMSEINSGLIDQLLYTINPVNGSLDTIGNLNLPAIDNFFYTPDDGINGLAYDPSLNVLYGITDNGKLFKINPLTAATTFVGNTVSSTRGLAYDGLKNELWAISAFATLFKIDKQTGSQLSSVICKEFFGNVTTLAVVPGICGNKVDTCSYKVYIEFEDCSVEFEYDFSFPNVITANGDGINDYFEIANLPSNTEVIILNRWGNVVFKSENYQNNWDGKDTSGKLLAEGVYTYKYTTENGETGHGFVHLLR